MVPPEAPSAIDQVTAVLLEPTTVAVNDCDPPPGRVTVDGATVMDIEIIGVEGGSAELLPPHTP